MVGNVDTKFFKKEEKCRGKEKDHVSGILSFIKRLYTTFSTYVVLSRPLNTL